MFSSRVKGKKARSETKATVTTTSTMVFCISVDQASERRTLVSTSSFSSAPPASAMSARASEFTCVRCFTVPSGINLSTCGPAMMPAPR